MHLTDLLGLQLYDGMQDWEVELADAARLGEFLDAYEDPRQMTMIASS